MTSKIPSEYHQLLITVSRHFHIGSKNQLRYQNKPMEVTLKKLEKSERNHFVHYIMRDVGSGFFYAECCSHRNLTPIRDFILRSWLLKKSTEFCGIPKSLVLPKTVLDFFGYDSFSSLIKELNVDAFVPTSGFSSGVRVIRYWEDNIFFKAGLNDDEDNELQNFFSWNPKTTAFYSKLMSWRKTEFYLTQNRFVPEIEYEKELIVRFASSSFQTTDLFPKIEQVSYLSSLMKIQIPD